MQQNEGDKTIVSEAMANTVMQCARLIEGQFMTGFEIAFEVDGKTYELILKEKK